MKHNLKNPLTINEGENYIGSVSEGQFYHDNIQAGQYVSKGVLEELLQKAKMYLPVLEMLEEFHPDLWDTLTKGTAITTTEGLKNAIKKATT